MDVVNNIPLLNGPVRWSVSLYFCKQEANHGTDHHYDGGDDADHGDDDRGDDGGVTDDG